MDLNPELLGSKSVFSSSLFQQILVQGLLCAEHCAEHGGDNSE